MKRIVNILFLLFILITSINYAQLRLEGIKREALKHMQNGRFGDAIDQLNKFIAADPRNPEGYYLRGLCREKREEYAYGREDYRKAIKLDNNYTEAHKALERLKKVWYEILYDKIEGHKRDIAVNPQNPYYYLEIGKAYRWLEEWEKAEEWYDKYLAMDKDASPDEIIRYTIILTETRHIYKGWLKLKEYTERYPDDWRLWSRFGWFSNWLGKYKIAEDAFLKALAFKPFFKEAQDGLDVARREAYVTIYSEDYNGNDNYRRKEYPIDKYYRIVRSNPDDSESRFKLVELLIEHERYEEAYQQLQILQEDHSDDERFVNYWDIVTQYRKKVFEEKVTESLAKLSEDKYNKQATLDLAGYYSSLSAYDDAEKLLLDYLNKFPDDNDARYKLAKIYSEDGKFQEGLLQTDTLLANDPSNNKYKLLTAQLNIWTSSDLAKAESLLMDVLADEPDNLYALISAGTLYFQLDNFEKAEEYLLRAENIQKDNPELFELRAMIESEKIRIAEQKLLEKLDEGREIASNGDCETALPYYEEYLDKYPDNYQLQAEYADILVCADRYEEALDIYDRLLDDQYDVELDKRRAKIYYWSGDTLSALDSFERLVREDPEDLEMQLYLGDSYARMHEYAKARDVYLALRERAPESYIINQRLEWLPPEYQETTTLGRIFSGVTNYLFSYMTLNPFSNYFNDNLGFEYYYYGGQLGIGFTKYVSLGGALYQGRVNNTTNSFQGFGFSTIKGLLFIHPFNELTISLGYGKVNSPGIINKFIYEGNISAEPLQNLKLGLRYEHNDGVFHLYSNELINRRIPSNILRFDGQYRMRTGLLLKTYYSLIWTNKNKYEKENIGNIFQGRIGKYFTTDLAFGYEYHFEDFKYNSSLYYTPQTYYSHSIWGLWQVFRNQLWDFKLEGKLGYVPQSDFIIREAKAEASYYILKNLRLGATAYLSSSVQYFTAYSSGAFYVNLFWSVY